AIATVRYRHRVMQRQPARDPLNLQEQIQATNPFEPGFKPREFATGLVVTNPRKPGERLILTNYHVVQGGRRWKPDGNVTADARIFVWFNRHQVTEATIYAADPRSDLAVLKFDLRKLGLAPADIAAMPLPTDNRIRKGQFVIALGNPYAIASQDGSPSVSLGIVSNISRFPFAETFDDKKNSIHHLGTLMHVDTRLGPGSSGGILLNREGKLIGITTSLAALEGYESTIGYAIPIDVATRRIIDELIDGYEVEYGFLGVQLKASSDPVYLYGDPSRPLGVEVEKVLEDSPAEAAGMRSGDKLLAVQRKPLYEKDDLFREIGLVAPGAVAHIRVDRSGREIVLKVHVGKWPVTGEGIIASETRFPPWRGLHVDWPTSRLGGFDRENAYPRAVYVRKVDAGSSAGRIEAGRFIVAVNSERVETPAEFHKAVENIGRAAVSLRLQDGTEVSIRP
ncbi:MAG: trypsin-like peptidase domain-containing protein, partial [Planctomycetaceae bacterium]